MNLHSEGITITPPTNAASLCRQFVLKARQNASKQIDIAFADALGIQNYDTNNADHQDLVRAAVTSLRKQQQAIILTLSQNLTVEPELYGSIVAANTSLSRMGNVQQPLTNFPDFNSPEYPLALGWAAHALPSDGGTTETAIIVEALNDIVALKARLAGMRFPTEVHHVMDHLLNTLEHGIVTASFEGHEALVRACRTAMTEVTNASERLREASGSLTEDQHSFLKEAAEKAEKVGKIAGGLTAALTFAEKIVPTVLKVFGG